MKSMSLPHGVRRKPRSNGLMFIMLVSAVPSFLLGAISTLLLTKWGSCAPLQHLDHETIEERIREQLEANQAVHVDRLVSEKLARDIEALCVQQTGRALEDHHEEEAVKAENVSLFPLETVGRFGAAMARVNVHEFATKYDMGVPLDRGGAGSEELLLLYGNIKTVPKAFGKDMNTVPELGVSEALESCDYLNVVLTDHGNRHQCLAIIPQYESYHVQKWMRADSKSALDSSKDLQLVSRGQKSNGQNEFYPPTDSNTRKHWEMLQLYFENVDDVLGDLKPILEKISVDNTVIVMVVNFGQSELLMNFVCSSRARGFDLSNVIVFTTDKEATDLVNALGLTAYYDKRNFDKIPGEAARRYGDPRFVAMMMAKVICVQLISMLGYDLLFQDVDIIWYQDPMKYFKNKSLPAYNYDVFFQDDGGHSIRYAPYSANSGFYYVKNNKRTKHFLKSILMAGDLILSTDSHQQALIATLNEHVSLFGLKAKVLSRDMEEFPGGFQFHRRDKSYMKKVFAGDLKPIIFHMSWTKNKDNKLLFFRQMGEWYVRDQCVAKKTEEIGAADGSLPSTCCSAEPIVSCHYRDKPSVKPCKDSPPIDKGGHSWW